MKAQNARLRATEDFATFFGHSPDTATPDELRAYQLRMTDIWIAPTTLNARCVAPKFFFRMACNFKIGDIDNDRMPIHVEPDTAGIPHRWAS